MPHRINFQPVKVASPGQTDGRLVFVDESLVAVVTRLDDTNDAFAGRWFAEAQFDSMRDIQDHTFGSLNELEEYIALNYGRA